jgi:hypothetical protein
MKRSLMAVAARACCLVVAWLLALSVPIQGEVIDRVLAVVAGNLILQSDVTAARDLGLITVGAQGAQGARDAQGAGGDIQREVLARLIDRALILAEVERYAPPEPDAANVEREVLAIRERFTSAPAFDAALARSGISEDHVRGTIREDLRIRAYLEQRFTVAAPTEEELSTYYQEHRDRFVRDGEPEPFDRARGTVAAAVASARRQTMVNEWVAGLRRRAEVIDLYER